MAIGFIKSKNLSESTEPELDEAALNNLYGRNISSDIELFSNNLKNESRLTNKDFVLEDDTFVITNFDKVAFSNQTQIFTGENKDIELTVIDSNGSDRFKLLYANNEFYTDDSHDLIRKDIILFENFDNFRREREWSDVQSTSSETGGLNIGFGDNEEIDSRTAFKFRTSQFSQNDQTVLERFDEITANLSQVQLKRNITPLINENFNANEILNINGSFTITNDDSILLDQPDAPGLYITNGTTEARAFSSDYNPWEEANSTLSTESSLTTIKKLSLTNPTITTIDLQNETESNTDVVLDFTHKLEINIDGSTYALLCKKL